MSSVTVLLFTRYPRPGQTKTRLIPALGEVGAAALQRRMSEQVVATARQFTAAPNRRLEIWTTGAEFRAFGLWLGFDLKFRDQGFGDLGERLQRAVADAFLRGATSVVVVGSDCPALPGECLEEAFLKLASGVDLVLGPAHDGGYYLIGLNRVAPALFAKMPWGTEKVLAATQKAADALAWQTQTLQPLVDIDRPEDLVLWLQVAEPKLSIIIPVLNEAENLSATLAALQLQHFPGVVEVAVVDGGSKDGSLLMAENAGCRVLSSAAGRGLQMNIGARAARGEYLLFLHADTLLPPDYLDLVCRCLSRPGVALGAFSLAFADQRPIFRFLEKMISWRGRVLGFPYGDQALFVSRRLFDRVGGFWSEPILEDVDFLRKIKKKGKLIILPARVATSTRRWQHLGVLRVTLINQLVMLGYYLGVLPKYLARFYRWR